MLKLSEVKEEIKKAPKQFYVYVLHKPNGVAFYVGKAKVQPNRHRIRIAYHECEARSDGKWKRKFSHNLHKINTIKKIWQQNKEVLYSIDSWHETEESVYLREKELIRSLGRKSTGDGPLTNLTDGGEKEMASVGVVTKALISDSLKQYYLENPEALEKMSERATQQFSRPEARETARQNSIKNNSAGHIINWLKTSDPKVLEEKWERHSGEMKEWHATENGKEVTKKAAIKRNETVRTVEHRLHMAEQTRKYNEANPEAHALRRAKAKATIDARSALRQECLLMIQADLVASGKLKNSVSKIASTQINLWKKNDLLSEEITQILNSTSLGGDWSKVRENLLEMFNPDSIPTLFPTKCRDY